MKDQPLGWEYLLFAELLNDYIKECEDVKRDLVYRNPLGERIVLEDPIEIVYWIKEHVRLLESIAQFMARLMNEAFRKAVGEPGQSGDAEHIRYVAKKFIEGYKSIIEWRLKFFSLNVDPTFSKLLNLTSDLASNVIKETEEFVIRVHKEVNEVFNSSFKDEEGRVIRFNVDLGIPDSSEFAYSGASRHLIPFESATQFRFIPPPDSGGFRHGNPAQTATPRGGISDAG